MNACSLKRCQIREVYLGAQVSETREDGNSHLLRRTQKDPGLIEKQRFQKQRLHSNFYSGWCLVTMCQLEVNSWDAVSIIHLGFGEREWMLLIGIKINTRLTLVSLAQ